MNARNITLEAQQVAVFSLVLVFRVEQVMYMDLRQTMAQQRQYVVSPRVEQAAETVVLAHGRCS